MDFNASIDLIIKDLEEAREIIDDLKKYKEVPVLQVEIAKMKCRSAAEVIALLKNINTIPAQEKEKPAEPEIHEPKSSDPVVHEPEPEIAETPSAPQQLPEEQLEHINIFTEEISNIEPEVIPDFKTEVKMEDSSVKRARARVLDGDTLDENKNFTEKEPNPEPAIEKVPGKKSEEVKPVQSVAPEEFINEVELKRSTIIADRFRKTEDEERYGIRRTKPLTSLSDAIGINDSFYFIREIFNGNKVTYSEALIKLEKAENLKDAKAVIMSYTGKNLHNEASLQLLDLIKRKLLLHE